MQNAQNYAKLLQGYAIPTGQTSQTTASGPYANSPLSDIAGIVSLINSYNNGTNTPTNALTSAQTFGQVAASAKNLGLSINADGTYSNAAGTKFKWDGSTFVAA